MPATDDLRGAPLPLLRSVCCGARAGLTITSPEAAIALARPVGLRLLRPQRNLSWFCCCCWRSTFGDEDGDDGGGGDGEEVGISGWVDVGGCVPVAVLSSGPAGASSDVGDSTSSGLSTVASGPGEVIARLAAETPRASLLVSNFFSLFSDFDDALLRSDPMSVLPLPLPLVAGTGGTSPASLPARDRPLVDEGVPGRELGRDVGVGGRDRDFMPGSEKP